VRNKNGGTRFGLLWKMQYYLSFPILTVRILFLRGGGKAARKALRVGPFSAILTE
jgi:hypothetical protein